MSECGVFSQDDNSPLRLDGCQIFVTLQTCAAQIIIWQEYKNVSLRPKAVAFRMPVPHSWVVVGVTLKVDDDEEIAAMKTRSVPDRVETSDSVSVSVPWTVSPSHTVMVAVSFLCPLWSQDNAREGDMTLLLPASLVPVPNSTASLTSEWRSNFSVNIANT